VKHHPRSWLWTAVAGAAIIGAAVLDTVPASANNGTLEATDLLPLPLYAFGLYCFFTWGF
jgi:hypothetical protein